jgi:hypothetical protein
MPFHYIIISFGHINKTLVGVWFLLFSNAVTQLLSRLLKTLESTSCERFVPKRMIKVQNLIFQI